jgi:rod shape determining protein RodA
MIRRLWKGFIAPLDPVMMIGLALLVTTSLIVLYSASDGNVAMVGRQGLYVLAGLVVAWVVSSVPLHYLLRSAVPVYVVSLALLVAVALGGEVSHGARRWLHLGFFNIQPSEFMKIGLPLMLAWYFEKHEATLTLKNYVVATVLLLVPVALIVRQPDLGTAILISASGFYVLFLAGLSWRVIGLTLLAAVAAAKPLWGMLHDYQKQRILILLDPSLDPLGKGYHTWQGIIAVGSGGILGKGYMNGSQTHLNFLPERTTDFIFAVYSEEFGFIGAVVLLGLYLFVIARGFVITAEASTYFTRLLAGSITLTFFTYAFVNMGMVTGILPVVGVPLPLVSYGGTSMLTLALGFGMLMSIHTHKQLVKT